MNITDNLIRIKEGKDNIIKSLKNKGVSINDNTLINEIPTIIDNAEIGGGGDTPIQPDMPELTPKYDGASVFRIEVPDDNYEFAINLCNDASTATYDVDWGDGVLESGLITDEQHHIYSKKGIYDVNVYNLSANITLGGTTSIGCFTSGTNNTNTYTKIVYLFNNTNNDIYQLSYKEFKDNICTNIFIGDKITYINSYAFSGCSSLQSIVIPEGVTTINSYAFSGCSSLQSIVIPEGVTTINSYAFEKCSSLQSIELPSTLTSIKDYAFQGCSSLQSIVIPEGVTTIGGSAFSSCSSLQSIELPSTLKSINGSIFYNVYYLQKIVSKSKTAPTLSGSLFPSSYPEFSKTYLYIPKDSVGYDSGNWKTSVIQIIYLEDYEKTPTTLKLKTKNNKLINLPYIGQAKLIDYELIDNEYIYYFDDKITQIPRGFFTNNPILQSIIIPEGVTAFGINSYGGSSSFSSCSSLQYVELPSTLKSITKSAFQNCSSLQSIVISETVTSIQDYVFSGCSSLQSITCKAMTAPKINGSSTFTNIGTNVPTDTPKVLRVPEGATGYDSGNWKTYVIDKGYTLEYVPLSEL